MQNNMKVIRERLVHSRHGILFLAKMWQVDVGAQSCSRLTWVMSTIVGVGDTWCIGSEPKMEAIL